MMEKLSIIDESFDTYRTESYILTIQFSLIGYKLCIIDSVRDSVISLICSPFDSALKPDDDWGKVLDNLFAQHAILSHKYKKVYLSFESPIFTLAPSELFIPEKSKLLLELVHPLPELYEVRFDEVKEMNVTIIYAIPSSLSSIWLSKQPKTRFVGHPTPFVTLGAVNKSNKDELYNYAFFSEQFFMDVLVKNKELLLCNSFPFYDTNDSTYHLINSCKLLGYDPNNTEISVSGSSKDNGALESMLAQYFKKVNSNNFVDGHNFTYSNAKYKSVYWNLFNLTLCE